MVKRMVIRCRLSEGALEEVQQGEVDINNIHHLGVHSAEGCHVRNILQPAVHSTLQSLACRILQLAVLGFRHSIHPSLPRITHILNLDMDTLLNPLTSILEFHHHPLSSTHPP